MRKSHLMICLALVTVLGLTLSVSAMAWRYPTQNERSAITRVLSRALRVSHRKFHISHIRVSTAGPWASAAVRIYFGNLPVSATDILHDVRGKWILVSSGTAGEGCVMPRKDQRSLGLFGYPCRH